MLAGRRRHGLVRHWPGFWDCPLQAATGVGTRDRASTTPPPPGCHFSIDALRGFGMCWIIGEDALIRALAHWADWPVKGPGRGRPQGRPPGQIRTCGATASGSRLGSGVAR